MTRSVLFIGESEVDGQLTANIENAEPPLQADYWKPMKLGYTGLQLPPVGDGVLYGQMLAQGLRRHPAIAALLQRAFNADNLQPHTLALHVRASDGRQIRWETLCDQSGFVALNSRCHIGRIAPRLTGTPIAARLFEPPLKILAFISGVGLDMLAEWDAIFDAIKTVVEKKLPVEATLCLGTNELLLKARSDCAKLDNARINVEPMPATSLALEQKIESVRPHLLHFFCHGRGGMGASFLELGTAQDHAAERPGSVVLGTDELARLAVLRDTWLVVLNCCSGAETVEDIESMAERLVSQTGTRAIGMLKPILSGEASLFCRALYPALFQLLDSVLRMQPGARPQYLDLTSVLNRPRRALQQQQEQEEKTRKQQQGQGQEQGQEQGQVQTQGAEDDGPRWTLPVLYQDLQPLEIVREALPAGNGAAAPVAQGSDEWRLLRARTEVVAGMLAALPPDTPDVVRDSMLAVLDMAPAVPRELRPDRNGRFNAVQPAAGGGA